MKKLHPCLTAGVVLLTLAACHPLAAEYTESEAPKQLTLDNASIRLDLRFVPGSSRLVRREASRLRALAASGRLASSDRILVATGGGPGLAEARFNTIAAELLPYGIVVGALPVAGVPANGAIVEAGRYLVTLPPCPNWSKTPSVRFTNTAASNFGCANVVDLGRMVANPADLVEGRPVGFADAIPAAAAVQRYQADKVQLPGAVSGLGPITPPSAGTVSGGATGAGTAGSQP